MTRSLPSDAVRQLLTELPATIPVDRVDRLWVFPPRQSSDGEKGLLVLSLYSDTPSPDHRQLVTVRYETAVSRRSTQRSDVIEEQGWAPAALIPGLIAGVLTRLGEEHAEPLAHQIDGDPDQWSALVTPDAEAGRIGEARADPDADANGSEADRSGSTAS